MSIHQICGVEPISTLPTLFRQTTGPFVWTRRTEISRRFSSQQHYFIFSEELS